MLGLILLVFAFVFAVIAAIFIASVSRPPLSIHFGWLAVALLIAALIFGGGHLAALH